MEGVELPHHRTRSRRVHSCRLTLCATEPRKAHSTLAEGVFTRDRTPQSPTIFRGSYSVHATEPRKNPLQSRRGQAEHHERNLVPRCKTEVCNDRFALLVYAVRVPSFFITRSSVALRRTKHRIKDDADRITAGSDKGEEAGGNRGEAGRTGGRKDGEKVYRSKHRPINL